MQITEHIAQFLRDNGFSCTTSGFMPQAPDRIASVYATGDRAKKDDEGSRFQIITRSEPSQDTAYSDIMEIIDLLEDFQGILTIDSPYVFRIMLESGASNIGTDDRSRSSYSANFRIFYC